MDLRIGFIELSFEARFLYVLGNRTDFGRQQTNLADETKYVVKGLLSLLPTSIKESSFDRKLNNRVIYPLH